MRYKSFTIKKNLDNINVRNETNKQITFVFFENLHIDLNVVIEKRKNFDAMIDRETIFVQNIDFFDIAIDKNFDKNFKKIIDNSIIDFDNTFSKRSRIIFNVKIAKNKNFDKMKNDEKDKKLSIEIKKQKK